MSISHFSIIIRLNTKSPNTNCIQTRSGGEDATRTHNALRHTTFPMWLLTIRIPLQATGIIIAHVFQKCKCFFKKNSFYFLLGNIMRNICTFIY